MINQNPAHYKKRKKYPRVLSFSGRIPKTHNSRECLRATLNKLVTHRSKTLYFMSHLLSRPILLSSSCYTHPDEPSHLSFLPLRITRIANHPWQHLVSHLQEGSWYIPCVKEAILGRGMNQTDWRVSYFICIQQKSVFPFPELAWVWEPEWKQTVRAWSWGQRRGWQGEGSTEIRGSLSLPHSCSYNSVPTYKGVSPRHRVIYPWRWHSTKINCFLHRA